MAISGFSDYYENQIIDHMLRNQAFAPPAIIYIALFTTMPNDDGTGGTEVSGGAYVRQILTLSAASGGVTSNSGDITFPVASSPWGTVVGFGLFDALSLGNLLMGGTFTEAKTTSTNDQLKINSGDLDLSVV